MIPILLLALALLVTGCTRRSALGPDSVPSPPAPPPPYLEWSDSSGALLRAWSHGPVNLISRQHITLPHVTSGPCAGRDQISDGFTVTYLGRYGGALADGDTCSGAGVHVDFVGPDLVGRGTTFQAHYDAATDRWLGVARATLTDGCRTAADSVPLVLWRVAS